MPQEGQGWRNHTCSVGLLAGSGWRALAGLLLSFRVDLASKSGLALAWFRLDFASGFHYFDFRWIWVDLV